MPLDLRTTCENKISQLKEWRHRYSKAEYPHKVVLNMLYDLYPLELVWPALEEHPSNAPAFDVANPARDFSKANQFVIDYHRRVQLEKVHMILPELIERAAPVGKFNIAQTKLIANKASTGSQEDVEEIEYTYVYAECLLEMALAWLACRLLKLSKAQSCLEVTGMVVADSAFDSYGSALEAFAFPVDQQLNGIAGVKPGYYGPLPPLW